MKNNNSNSSTMNDACRGLQGAVNTFTSSKKHQKRFRGTEDEKMLLKQHIQKLVRHAQHVLQTLTVKRTSLHHAVAALQDSWKTALKTLQASQSKSNLKSILQHILQHYLRLGDGMVLLTSGECRHAGDMPMPPAKNPYTSQLTNNKVRNDGYTMLYSKDASYSGFGWDEFFDDQHGLQARLLNALKRFTSKSNTNTNIIWETLLDTGAQLFESSLDAHETKLQAIRKSMEDFRDLVKRDLTKIIPKTKVQFGTQDKMEYLEIRGLFKLQRRANEFKVKDEEGVLPDGWNFEKWASHMTLPSRLGKNKNEPVAQTTEHNTQKKRRRVIQDSSDDDDADEGGLHVRENKTEEIIHKDMSSLNAIKTDFGVNASELETAREALEAEQGDVATDVVADDRDIQSARATVKRLRKVLHNAIDQKEDPLEIWDAREHVRRETMQLGNDLLALQSTHHLIDAKASFKEAVELVSQQEAAHKLIVKDTNDDTEGAWLIRRNLLLLKGRAQTNHGIALLDLSLVAKAPFATRKRHRAEAANELVQAQQCAQRLQTRAAADKKRGASASETALDTIDATQLEAHASRSYGSVLWHDGKQADAVKAFADAASTYRKIDKSVMLYVDKGADFLFQYLTNLVECYSASTTLFDLAATKIERLQTAGPESDTLDTKQKGKDLLNIASNAVGRAKPIVALVEKLAEKQSGFDYFLADNGMLKVDDIDEALDDLRQRWKERSEGNTIVGKPLASSKQESKLPRNDLGIGMLTSSRGNGPTRGFVVADNIAARRSRNKRGTATDRDFDYSPPVHDDEATAKPTISYMKWGDELLPQTATSTGGEPASRLQYPACAPPLPPGFSLQ